MSKLLFTVFVFETGVFSVIEVLLPDYADVPCTVFQILLVDGVAIGDLVDYFFALLAVFILLKFGQKVEGGKSYQLRKMFSSFNVKKAELKYVFS